MRSEDLVSVRFIVANAPYMSGEIAGFEPTVAKRFVDRKRAVYYKPEDQPDASPAAETEPKPKAKPRAKAKAKK